MSDPRSFGDGTLSRAATTVHWFLLLELWFLLATAPGLALAFWLAPDPSNLPLFALAAVPLGPALAAALFAWRRRDEATTADDVAPSPSFRRGYAVNLRDALAVWVPAVAVLLVLGVNVSFGGGTAGGALAGVQVVLAVVVLLVALRALAVASTFSFRLRDVLRIAVFTLYTTPLRTLGLLSSVVLAVGLTVVTFDAVVVLLASVLTFGLLRNEAPVLDLVRERFVASG